MGPPWGRARSRSEMWPQARPFSECRRGASKLNSTRAAALKDPSPLALLIPSLPTAAELRPWLESIDHAKRYTNFGPLCKRLESELAGALVGPRDLEVAAVANGTLGLELALHALRLPRQARVLLPSLSFAATASAVLRAGLKPVFGDVDPDHWCLSPAAAFAATDRIDAVMPVAVFGRGLEVGAWDAFTETTGLPVLIDAAGAFGNQEVGRTSGAVFSMHATKALAAGEGGFVACPDPAFARAIRVGSNFGYHHETTGHGTVEQAGTNAKISEYHAAVGLAALAHWPAQSARRIALAQAYAASLRGLGDKVILQDAGTSWVRSVFVVRLPSGVDDGIIEGLAGLGIESRRWYWPPLHRHPAFAEHDRVDNLPHTEMLAGQLIGLPFHLHLEPDSIVRVCESLAGFLP